jgi:hypothetical protein
MSSADPSTTEWRLEKEALPCDMARSDKFKF